MPWVNYQMTFQVKYPDRNDYYACARFNITQLDAAYVPVPGYITAAMPPFALLTGILDTLLSSDRSLLGFIIGDGSAYRYPGFFDLWEHAQWIAMTGMLGGHYPAFYQKFISYFSWSFFNWKIDFIDKLAGQSRIAKEFPNNLTSYEVRTMNEPSRLTRRDDTTQMNLDEDSDNSEPIYSVIRSGIAAYAQSVGTWADRLIQVTCYTYLLVMLSVAVLFALSGAVYWCLLRYRGVSSKSWISMETLGNLMIGIFLRITVLAYLPILLVTIHHLLLPSPASFGSGGIIIASLAFTILVAGPIYIFYVIFSGHSPTALFDNEVYLLRIGTIYNTLTAGRLNCAIMPFARRVAYALIIGGGQRSGIAQICCLLFVEIVWILAELWLVPRTVSYANQISILSGLIRGLGWLFFIPLLSSIDLDENGRQAAGFAFILAHLLFLLIWLILLIRSFVKVLLAYRKARSFGQPDLTPGRLTLNHNTTYGVNMNDALPSPRLGIPSLAIDTELDSSSHPDSTDLYQPPNMNRNSFANRHSNVPSQLTDQSYTSTNVNRGKNGNWRHQSMISTDSSQGLHQNDGDFLREARHSVLNEVTPGTPNSYHSVLQRDEQDQELENVVTSNVDDDLFCYVTPISPTDEDPSGANGTASANQPRLMPAFLRYKEPVNDSSGEDTPTTQTAFPRYMLRSDAAPRV
jgi:hypothetical protein